jgi:hypothetical protein
MYQSDEVLRGVLAEVVHQHPGLVAAQEIVEVRLEKVPRLKTSFG